jgi:alkanesulfonate monooxygenase SsuD/methylene tetrahydromethanopterin reductase-like flavin-dependent oxidoreductase (luciferase family)
MKIGLSPLQGQASFEETLRECEQAEAAGFDSIWLGEHHNNPVLYPAPLIGLAAVASRTRRIGLGTGVLLLPLYHPVMVAEEGAMVDMISGSRLILGGGAGYAEEFAAFGYSLKERGRIGEALRSYTASGRRECHSWWKALPVDNATIAPSAAAKTTPSGSAPGRPAIPEPALGRRVVCGAVGQSRQIAPSAPVEACREMGKPEEVALFRYIFVASSTKEAISLAGGPFIQAFERMYFRWPHPVVKRPAGQLTIERLAEDRIILGDPRTCVKEIIRFRRELGATHLVCRFSVPGIPRPACQTSLDLFTREVMPALRADGS